MTLDASAFPHLLDAIISFASPATLITLRTVSRDLCTRVDALLFTNIVVTAVAAPPGFSPTLSPLSPSSSPITSMVSGPRIIVLATPCGHRLPAPPLPSRPAPSVDNLTVNATLRPLLRYARVVHLRSLSLSAAYTLAALLPRLDIVHRHTAQPWDSPLLKADTYVDHVELDHRPSAAGCMPNGDVPSDLKRLIVRFTFDPALCPPPSVTPEMTLSVPPNVIDGALSFRIPGRDVLRAMNPPLVPEIIAVADPTGPSAMAKSQVRYMVFIISKRLPRARPTKFSIVGFDDLKGYHVDRVPAATIANITKWAKFGLSRSVVVPLRVLRRDEWEACQSADILAR